MNGQLTDIISSHLPLPLPLLLVNTEPDPLSNDVIGMYHWRSEYRNITNDDKESAAMTTWKVLTYNYSQD